MAMRWIEYSRNGSSDSDSGSGSSRGRGSRWLSTTARRSMRGKDVHSTEAHGPSGPLPASESVCWCVYGGRENVAGMAG